MGGDLGVAATVAAALDRLHAHAHLRLSLFGDAELIDRQLAGFQSSRLQVEHCVSAVGMDEKVSSVLRTKADSSMARAMLAVRDGQADALVSAGNTAALVILGLQHLGMLPGIERPALCCAMPSRAGRTWMLDMGATLEPSVDQLVQFTRMGSCQVHLGEGMARPRIGLLNVGAELCKGTSAVRQVASQLEQDTELNYCGFAEGADIFSGRFDLIVCDGFAGNVALKTAEGVAGYIGDFISDFGQASWINRLALGLFRSRLRQVRQRIDPAEFNGAPLLGLNGLVVKSRGGAQVRGFARALELAAGLVQSRMLEGLRSELGRAATAPATKIIP